jgi:hypothetical protein
VAAARTRFSLAIDRRGDTSADVDHEAVRAAASRKRLPSL